MKNWSKWKKLCTSKVLCQQMGSVWRTLREGSSLYVEGSSLHVLKSLMSGMVNEFSKLWRSVSIADKINVKLV